jgi:hypothetical protein
MKLLEKIERLCKLPGCEVDVRKVSRVMTQAVMNSQVAFS